MSSSRLRLRRASFSLNLQKHNAYKSSTRPHGLHDISPSASNLTPDIQLPTSKPLLLDPATVGANFVRIGNYLVSGEAKDTAGSSSIRDAVNIITEERLTCKVVYYDVCDHLIVREWANVVCVLQVVSEGNRRSWNQCQSIGDWKLS